MKELPKIGEIHPNGEWVWAGDNLWLLLRASVYMLYTNYKGETRWRKVIPLYVPPKFESTPYHPTQQWIQKMWDLEKNEERSFALLDIKGFSKEAPT